MKKIVILSALMALLLSACGASINIEKKEDQNIGGVDVQVEEIKFRSGRFKVVGDLRIPDEGDRHPAVILVHGSGKATRHPEGTAKPTMDTFLRNGYAVFSWDKPGSGMSTGDFRDLHKERAEILADGIQVLVEHPAIDPDRIGLWGISQAGWIMPQVLEDADDVAFIIVVSGGGEDGIEQMAFQIGQQVLCEGGTEEEAALVEQYRAQAMKANSYEEYRQAMEILLGIDAATPYLGMNMLEEKDWNPPKWSVGAFFDPIDVIEQTTIPMLAFFGDLDKNVDPVQGAEAYEVALQKAGNPDYLVVFIEDAAHNMARTATGCLNSDWGTNLAPEYLETMEIWIQHLSS
jgi:pimeloyl-ACP methyl ester carboxylesterase